MSVLESRRALRQRIFPGGLPRLWCPALTHFRSDGKPDFQRIASHMKHLSSHVRGLLFPGSTGEGWEMSDRYIRLLMSTMLDIAHTHNMQVLIGVLKTESQAVHECIQSMLELMEHPAVAGITVCPPKGSTLSQVQIENELRRVLELGLPTALYQLPQVTENEMAFSTIQRLAETYSNFYLFKDTSGNDRVALSEADLQEVFMVRGSEQGGYDRWTKNANGPYDGFLLSTANVFAAQYENLLRCLDNGEKVQAAALSETLSAIVQRTFALVSEFEIGNAFTNANKALDHCFAFGKTAIEIPPPLLYSGVRLPEKYILQTSNILDEFGILPTAGYLA